MRGPLTGNEISEIAAVEPKSHQASEKLGVRRGCKARIPADLQPGSGIHRLILRGMKAHLHAFYFRISTENRGRHIKLPCDMDSLGKYVPGDKPSGYRDVSFLGGFCTAFQTKTEFFL